jgi:DNA-nicking Smr family endonuclease
MALIKGGKHVSSASPMEDQDTFRSEMVGVEPISPHGRVMHAQPNLPPLPLSLFRDQREVILESMQDPTHWDEETDQDKDDSYVRPGLSRQTLRRLRSGDWHIQAELDLHGLTRIEAKHELADFLHECKRRGGRCVRIIHGKGLGSPNKEPVLKHHVRHWLTQRDEVLAFVSARPVDGGSGAVVVLLKGR